ncbi:transposase [Chryseobacterium sp.]|uniref:transposase n=1 Tax=Chryseobacterium sp. TaxID=1871047 RepID=UPI0032195B95
MSFKEIHIGSYIEKKVKEEGLEMSRLQNFFNCSEKEILEMMAQPELKTGTLLMWSKILEYDFFRIYCQHLILYSPPKKIGCYHNESRKPSDLPQFRKNIYTREMIDFIIELITTQHKTKQQIVEEYRIPKTTLYKWLEKYSN